MIVLDTNVISALMLAEPDRAIAAWLDARSRQSLWLTAVSLFELRYGIETLAAGRRRNELERSLARVLNNGFQDRVLDLDQDAAAAAASIGAAHRRIGRPTEIRDTLIAGIVVSRGAEFATRNVQHFEGLGIRVLDPWSD